MLNFKQILQKLKYSDQFNRSSITREIIANLRHINSNDMLDLLELLHIKADIEFQVKLLSILTACLLFKNTNRDVIIKWTPLYETLRKILDKGLPMKSTVTLNFVTLLLYADDERGSLTRMLTLYAQGMIRSSGCLTAMTNLFTNYMLPIDTWNALCRCVAEVCRGCELNQTFCSHLIPLCIQRCLPGNLDAFPVLLSLLLNHKRNTHLFLKTDGKSLFDRKELFRVEECLQLLNTVIQNAEFEALSSMTTTTRIYQNLHELFKLQSLHSNVTQWATINLYYLDSRLKGKCNNENSNARYNNVSIVRNYVENMRREEDNELPNDNDTQMLFQNIMSEIFSHSPKRDGHNHNLWKHICKVPQTFPNINDIVQRVGKETNLYDTERYRFCNKEPPRNSSAVLKEQLSFSFLIDEKKKCNEPDHTNINSRKNYTNQANVTTTKYTCFRKELSHSQGSDTVETFNSNSENIIEFKPTFVSTPIRELSQMDSLHRISSVKKCFTKSSNKSRIRNLSTLKKIPKKSLAQDKSSIKHRSMSSRLLEAINESCTTVIKSVKNVFFGNKAANKQKESAKTEARTDQTYCSYSFTNYMRKRESKLMKLKDDTNNGINSEMTTHNTLSTCKTCDDTLLLKQKFDIDRNLKLTVKKLKLGIYLYGCDFKRISKTMWPRERYMTPTVLYSLYRKLILK